MHFMTVIAMKSLVVKIFVKLGRVPATQPRLQNLCKLDGSCLTLPSLEHYNFICVQVT